MKQNKTKSKPDQPNKILFVKRQNLNSGNKLWRCHQKTHNQELESPAYKGINMKKPKQWAKAITRKFISDKP